MLRCSSVGHDLSHGAILRGSPTARALMHLIGTVVLAPPRIWADTHNHHHAHNAVLGEPAVGTFPLWTTDEYRAASPLARLGYRLARGPLILLLAWPIVFVLGLNLLPALRDPWRHRGSIVALAAHLALNVATLRLGGPELWLCAVALPYGTLGLVGAWLFYAQHNFPGARWAPRGSWSFAEAALWGSSYLHLPPALAWFAGNIHYHHIHHLDIGVPFYRLPLAFAALPELQRPPDTSLRPGDVWRALRLKLWDPDRGELVGL